jgi:GNAT superfamily N-acetyltransferase
MMTLQLERVEQVWNEVMALAALHWQGTKTYRRHYPFSPSYERYKACNESGFYQLITARNEQGQLVGYFGLYLSRSMHSQHLMLTEDTFFLHPDYRGGRYALRFLQHIEQQAKQWGVEEIMFSCEDDNQSGIKKLLLHLEYEPVITQFSKRLSSPRADSAVSESTEAAHVGDPA